MTLKPLKHICLYRFHYKKDLKGKYVYKADYPAGCWRCAICDKTHIKLKKEHGGNIDIMDRETRMLIDHITRST